MVKITYIPNLLAPERIYGKAEPNTLSVILEDFAKEHKIDLKRIVVKVGGFPVLPHKWASKKIKDGVRVVILPQTKVAEIVAFLGLTGGIGIGTVSGGVITGLYVSWVSIVSFALWAVMAVASYFLMGKPSHGSTGGSSLNESPTYGWDRSQMEFGKNRPHPVVLGTHDFSGKLLNAYISGEKQFKYNWGTITPTGVSNSNWVNLFTTPEVRGFKFKLQATKRITNMVDTYDMEGNFVSYDVGKYIALYKIEYKPHSSPNWTIWNPNFYVDGSATVLLDYLPVDSYDVRITNLSKEASKWKNKAFYTTSLRGRVTVTDLQISDDQHLYLLIDAGEGPIGGISNIRIEGQSIEQYLAVEYDIRMGENEQTVIPWFQDDIIAQYPSQKVTNAGITYTTVRSDVEGWEIGFALPNLFKSIEGGIYQNTVTFNISYRLTGTSNWTSWGDFDITGKSLNTMYRSLKYPGPGETALTSGQYDIKITRISPEYTSSSAAGELTFYYINEIAHKPFCFPNTALLALKILATNQLSGGIPNIVFREDGVKVKNLVTGVIEYTTNTGYLLYAVLTNKRWGMGQHIPSSSLVIQDFIDIAARCDEQVKSGNSETADVITGDLLKDWSEYFEPDSTIGKTIFAKAPSEG